MESVFSSCLNDDQKSIVSFSSGQNENFTDLYEPYLERLRRELNQGVLRSRKSLYFDKDWASLLILLALYYKGSRKEGPAFVPTGLCSTYLQKKNYRVTDFEFSIRIPKDFFRIYTNEEFRRTSFVSLLEKITDLDFVNDQQAVREKSIKLSQFGQRAAEAQTLDGIQSDQVLLSITDLLDSLIGFSTDRHERLIHLIEFFQVASIGAAYVNLKNNRLIFQANGTSFPIAFVSDGEYQLLSTYAIIDLFSGHYRNLLLDEVDSHVHTSSIPELWKALSTPSDCIIVTSTHSPVSLKYVDSNRIISLRDGTPRDGLLKISDLQQVFDSKNSAENVLALCFRSAKNIVLIDSLKDWEILLALLKKKLGTAFRDELHKYTVHELPSTRENLHHDKDSKDLFIDKLLHIYDDDLSAEEKEKVELEFIVSLKDRDNEALQNAYGRDGTFNIVRSGHRSIQLTRARRLQRESIFLNRREIENYLLVRSVVERAEPGTILGRDAAGREVSKEQVLADFGNEEFLATLDVKGFLNTLICDLDGSNNSIGFSRSKMQALVDQIPTAEVSNYLVCVHRYLCERMGL
jgi:hypothetical protein